MSELDSLSRVFAILPEAVVVVDTQGRIACCNALAEALFRYEPGALAGIPLTTLIPARLRASHARHFAAFAGLDGDDGRVPMSDRPILPGLTRCGEEIPIAVALGSFEADGQSYHVAIVRDQRAVAMRYMAAISAAETDVLTGIPNRRHALQRLAGMLEAGRPFALLYLDLDRFKPINDRHGHAAGDAVLRVVAQRLQGGLRRLDSCARLGGDEFLALLHDTDTVAAVTAVGTKLHRHIGAPVHLDGTMVEVGVSIGAILCSRACSPPELLARADAVMYRAKQLRTPLHLLVEDDSQ